MADANAKRHLEAIFKLLDFDNSGYIEEMEGLRVGKAMNYSPVFEYWEELKKLDEDKDGKISKDEFVNGHSGYSALMANDLREKMESKLANLTVQGGLPPARPTKAGGLAPLRPIGGGGAAPLAPIGGGPSADPAVAAKAKAAFEKLDKDGSGALDKAEVFEALQSLCDESDAESIGNLTSFVDQEYNKADRNLNGKLDLSEFSSIYTTFTNSLAVKKK